MNMQLQSGGGGTDPTHTKPGTERRDRIRALVKKIFGPPEKADRLKILPLNRKDQLSFAEGLWLEWFNLCNWQIATTPRNRKAYAKCRAPCQCRTVMPPWFVPPSHRLFGTGRRWVFRTKIQPLHPWQHSGHILQEAEWAYGLIWTARKTHTTGFKPQTVQTVVIRSRHKSF
jgi:hypothetical protein